MTLTQVPGFDQGTKYLVGALLFLLACLPPGWAAEPPPPLRGDSSPLVGCIWLPAERRFVPPEQLMRSILDADAVSLGEIHDNADHHALQAWVVRRLAAAGRRPVLVLEMVDADQQPVLDAAGADLAGLGEALAWERRGWPDWGLYRPMAEAAMEAGGRLVAGNLPLERVRAIARGADVTAEETGSGLDAAERRDMEAEIRAAHCGLLPEVALPAMVRAQHARDTALARALAAQVARPELGPAVLVTGSGHARRDRGAMAQFVRLMPRARPFALAFAEAAAGEARPAASLPYDAVWFTAPARRDDPCEQLARHLGPSK